MVNWKDLALSPAFRALFTDPHDNPVMSRIQYIQSRMTDLDITDPVDMMRWKAELAGIEFVKRAVEAKSEMQILQTEPHTTSPSLPSATPHDPRMVRLARQMGGRPTT